MNLKVLKSFDKNVNKTHLKISVCNQNKEIAQIFSTTFQTVQLVKIIHGNIFHLGCDALISPANSFGDMSGGIDKTIDDFYR